jgi:hypothetical protein
MTVTLFFEIPFDRRNAAGEPSLPCLVEQNQRGVMFMTVGYQAVIHLFSEKTSINTGCKNADKNQVFCFL